MKLQNKIGQTAELKLEFRNGDEFSLTKYLKNLFRFQDLDAWKAAPPQQFENFVRNSIIDVVKNLDIIYK